MRGSSQRTALALGSWPSWRPGRSRSPAGLVAPRPLPLLRRPRPARGRSPRRGAARRGCGALPPGARGRPRWVEGLWALGTIAYEQDRFAECRDVFARLAAVQPKLAAAWALRGLCEFRLGAAAERAHAPRAGRRARPAGPRRAGPSGALPPRAAAEEGRLRPRHRAAQRDPRAPAVDAPARRGVRSRPAAPTVPSGIDTRGRSRSRARGRARRTAPPSRVTPSRPCRATTR